jgi:S1-C subfamily serine protease
LQRTLKRQSATKAQLETTVNKLLRLLQAAVEGVRNAAHHLDAAQRLQQAVSRASHMQDHRQPSVTRQLQLRCIEMRLQGPVQSWHKVIQTDLTHGHQTRVVALVLQGLLQPVQITRLRLVHVERVQTQRIRAAMLVGQGAHGVELRSSHRWQHQARDAGRVGALHHGVAVSVKLGGVEVAVRINPHVVMIAHAAEANAIAWSPRRAAQRDTVPQNPSLNHGVRMQKAPLYSRSPRPSKTDTPLLAPTAPSTAAPSAAASAPVKSPPMGWAGRRWRATRAWSARHAAPLWGLGGGLMAIVAMLVMQHFNPGRAPITQDDINAAVRESLETEALPSAAAKAYETILPSVVRVVGLLDEKDKGEDNPEQRAMERSLGTGVVIIDNGTILTNLHVVSGAKKIRVRFFNGQESDAVLVGAQPENDLAVLRAQTLPDDLEAATMRSTSDLRTGEHVIAVGHPFGIGPSVSYGVVSGLKREFRSPEGNKTLTNLIQFDAAANPGNSGGPLVTMEGEVVGIVTAILNPSEQRTFIGIGFAVPIEAAASAAGTHPF